LGNEAADDAWVGNRSEFQRNGASLNEASAKRQKETAPWLPSIAQVKGQLTGLTPLRNIRMEFAVEALYSLLQAH
jgi:hypothetical protein